MEKLDNAIRALGPFSNLPEIKGLVPYLRQIKASQAPNRPKSVIISQVRETLLKLLQGCEAYTLFDKQDELANAVQTLLLVLAKISPINLNDPITLQPISSDNQVFSGSGYQFDLKHLIQFHNTRPLRKALKETQDNKGLLNPFTNSPFNRHDKQHFLTVAKQRQLSIHSLYQPPIDYRQTLMMKKIERYLRLQAAQKNGVEALNRTEIADIVSETHGYCHGLSLFWLYEMSKPNNTDAASFFNLLEHIQAWDGLTLETADAQAFEKLFSHITWLQGETIPLEFKQGDVSELLAFVHHDDTEPIVLDGDETLPANQYFFDFDEEKLAEYLEQFIHPNKMLKIGASGHMTAVYLHNKHYYFYDANHPQGMQMFNTPQQLAHTLFKAHWFDETEPYLIINAYRLQAQATSNYYQPYEWLLNHLEQASSNSSIQGLRQRALGKSILDNNLAMLKVLLARHANPNQPTQLGDTPMQLAAMRSNKKLIDTLIESGAKILSTTEPNNLTPLYCALKFNTPEIAEYLLTHETLSEDEQAKLFFATAEQAIENDEVDCMKALWEIAAQYHQSLLEKHKAFWPIAITQACDPSYWQGQLESIENTDTQATTLIFERLKKLCHIIGQLKDANVLQTSSLLDDDAKNHLQKIASTERLLLTIFNSLDTALKSNPNLTEFYTNEKKSALQFNQKPISQTYANIIYYMKAIISHVYLYAESKDPTIEKFLISHTKSYPHTHPKHSFLTSTKNQSIFANLQCEKSENETAFLKKLKRTIALYEHKLEHASTLKNNLEIK